MKEYAMKGAPDITLTIDGRHPVAPERDNAPFDPVALVPELKVGAAHLDPLYGGAR